MKLKQKYQFRFHTTQNNDLIFEQMKDLQSDGEEESVIYFIVEQLCARALNVVLLSAEQRDEMHRNIDMIKKYINEQIENSANSDMKEMQYQTALETLWTYDHIVVDNEKDYTIYNDEVLRVLSLFIIVDEVEKK